MSDFENISYDQAVNLVRRHANAEVTLVLGFQLVQLPGLPVPPGAVTPSSRTWTS